MEAVVSLLVLGILMTTIIGIIRFSMVITGSTLADATTSQNDFNRLMQEEYDAPVSGSLVFRPDGTIPGFFEARHDIEVTNQVPGAFAFRPKE